MTRGIINQTPVGYYLKMGPFTLVPGNTRGLCLVAMSSRWERTWRLWWSPPQMKTYFWSSALRLKRRYLKNNQSHNASYDTVTPIGSFRWYITTNYGYVPHV